MIAHISEWSNELDLSSNGSAFVGSNPTVCNIVLLKNNNIIYYNDNNIFIRF